MAAARPDATVQILPDAKDVKHNLKNRHILQITAETEIGTAGQRCTAVVLDYDKPLSPDVPASAFSVQGRTVVGLSVSGQTVTIALSPDDRSACTVKLGNPWKNIPATMKTPHVTVQQIKPLQAEDGSVIPAAEAEQSSQVRNLVADDFLQGKFEGLTYNLFIPNDCVPGERYPLVQFIHDAATCGPDPHLTLAQGMGAVIWARPEEQAKRKCFVLAPQFDGPPIVDDDWNVDARLETAKRLLDWVCQEYSVDRGRIYSTGQSMGCMSSLVLNMRYPELFAASFLVAGHWDTRQTQGLEKQNLWMLNSMGDAMAFPYMNQLACELESKGATVARQIISAKAPQKELEAAAEVLIATGANTIYTPYAIESVANGWHSRGGEHHINTWKTAYNIEAVRRWLFSKARYGSKRQE